MGEVGRGGLVVKVKRAHCVLDLLSLLFEVGSKEVFPDFYCTHWDALNLCFALEFSVQILGNTYFSRGFYFAQLKNIT